MGEMVQIKEETNDLQSLLLRIRSKYPSLTDAAKRVADYIANNHTEAIYLNISELAKKSDVSESTVTKFIKTIGYNGFQELKICLARTSTTTKSYEVLYGEISLDDDVEAICNKVFHNNIEALKDSLKVLDFKSLEKAAKLIAKANKVDLYGMGSSTIATLNAKMRLYRLGITCLTYSDPNQQCVSASLMKKGDVAIGISNSGQSLDVVRALEIARNSGAVTICITSYDDNPITKVADIKLFTSTKDSDELGESINSRVAELSLLDALYVCVASNMKKKAMDSLHKSAEAIKIHKRSL